MGKNNETDLSRWVDNRLEPLRDTIDFRPDLKRGLVLFGKSRDSARARGRRGMWAACVAIITSLGALAFPVTRVFANRCVDACVAALSSSGDSAVPLNQLAGKIAPDFSAADSSGAMVRLSDLRGKVVVLNFWATWCAPCNRETPWFVEFQRKYGAQGLVVVGASVDDDGWKSVRPFMDAMKVNYRMIIADRGIAHLYGGLEALPATLVIDRSGRVVVSHEGLIDHDDFETGIQALLGGGREVSDALMPDPILFRSVSPDRALLQ